MCCWVSTCFSESASYILVVQECREQGVHPHEAVIIFFGLLYGSLQHLAHFITELHLHRSLTKLSCYFVPHWPFSLKLLRPLKVLFSLVSSELRLDLFITFPSGLHQ